MGHKKSEIGWNISFAHHILKAHQHMTELDQLMDQATEIRMTILNVSEGEN